MTDRGNSQPEAELSADLGAVAQMEFPIVTYEITRERIREYVVATRDPNPIYRDATAAADAGHKDVVAPPTFAAVFVTRPIRDALSDPDWVRRSTIDPATILHGEQGFAFTRPLYPGDRLLVQSIVAAVRQKGRLGFAEVVTRVTDDDGLDVLRATTTLVLRPRRAISA